MTAFALFLVLVNAILLFTLHRAQQSAERQLDAHARRLAEIEDRFTFTTPSNSSKPVTRNIA